MRQPVIEGLYLPANYEVNNLHFSISFLKTKLALSLLISLKTPLFIIEIASGMTELEIIH